MQNREPGLDMLRILALLFVVTFHSFLYNGFYSEAQSGVFMLTANAIRWLSVSCIGIFLMLTGYLKSQKPLDMGWYRGLLPIATGYLLAAAVSVPVRHFLLGDAQSFTTWLTRLFGFSAVYYGWYVEMYLGLMLLCPFVNILLKHLDERQMLWLCLTLLFTTALSGTTKLSFAPDYWRMAYPLTYYVLGAAVRRLQPKVKPVIAIAGALTIALALGSITLLSTDGTISDAYTLEFADLPITAMVLCMFIALYRLHPGKRVSRLLSLAAGGCYGGYLLSHLLDASVYRLAAGWHTPPSYGKLFLLVTLPIWIVSLLLGRLLQAAVRFSGKGAAR